MKAASNPDVSAQLSSIGANLTEWFAGQSNRILAAAVVSLLLVAGLYAVRLAGRRMARQPGAKAAWRGVIGRALGSMRFWFMATVAVEIVSVYAIAPPELAEPIRILFVIALGLQTAFFLRELILGGIELRAAEADPAGTLGSAINLLRLLITIALFGIAIIFILANLGVDVTGLLAGLGIGGIAIGLAAQGIFSDLFAALSILFDKPFRRGDTVRWDTTSGTIETIGLKSTRIRAITGEEIIISNANLLSKELRNFTRLEQRRIVQTLSLIYQTSGEQCATLPGLLKAAIDQEEGCSFVRCGLDTFGPSSLDFQLVYDVEANDPELVLLRKNAANLAIMRVFAETGFSFAYPTQTTFTAGPDGTMIMPYAPPPTPVAAKEGKA